MIPRRRKVPRALISHKHPKARRFFGKYFSLTTFPLAGGSQFSVVVPKSIVKKAVTRTKYKRAAYAAVQSKLSAMLPGRAGIFYLTVNPPHSPRASIQNDITGLLSKSGITG